MIQFYIPWEGEGGIYQYFMSINSLFNTVSVSRYSRLIFSGVAHGPRWVSKKEQSSNIFEKLKSALKIEQISVVL
jgi:hypothetical protein